MIQQISLTQRKLHLWQLRGYCWCVWLVMPIWLPRLHTPKEKATSFYFFLLFFQNKNKFCRFTEGTKRAMLTGIPAFDMMGKRTDSKHELFILTNIYSIFRLSLHILLFFLVMCFLYCHWTFASEGGPPRQHHKLPYYLTKMSLLKCPY